ncbi:MAG: phosphatase PAP2 family protein [Acidimicrobiales bacterium]
MQFRMSGTVKPASWGLWRDKVAVFDKRADDAFACLRGNPSADRIFYAASALGDHSLVWALLGAARGLRPGPVNSKAAVRLGVAILVESGLVNIGIKTIFRRSRPDVTDFEHPHQLRRPLTSSFPSGHATSAVCSAILLSEGDPAWPAYAALAVVVATSRVHVRIHHASDVVGGAAIGAILGLIARKIAPLGP